MACSTCHVILPKEFYDRLPEKCMEEEDMLDLAWGVTETWVMCDDLTFRNI
jgi:ferredoxin-2, mitochondrial